MQELLEDDFDRCIEYCELLMMRIENNGNLMNNVVFSDEAIFMLNGNVNRYNWADGNLHRMREAPHTVSGGNQCLGGNYWGPNVRDLRIPPTPS